MCRPIRRLSSSTCVATAWAVPDPSLVNITRGNAKPLVVKCAPLFIGVVPRDMVGGGRLQLPPFTSLVLPNSNVYSH
jgi:hypothetical protein